LVSLKHSATATSQGQQAETTEAEEQDAGRLRNALTTATATATASLFAKCEGTHRQVISTTLPTRAGTLYTDREELNFNHTSDRRNPCERDKVITPHARHSSAKAT
jgi:hypothetical protein